MDKQCVFYANIKNFILIWVKFIYKFLAEIKWNKLGAYLKETQILGSIQNTLYWDQNTGMPKKGASWRLSLIHI